MKSMLASMAVVLTFCAVSTAATEFPKTGSAEYDTDDVDNPVAKIDSGACTGVIGEETGMTRNVKGEGPFHDMTSVRCLYHWSVVGETNHVNGSCVDRQRWRQRIRDLRRQNHYLIGGTGKYKGITGTVAHESGPSRHGRWPRGAYNQPQGHLGDQVTEADCSEPCQRCDGRISTVPPNWNNLIKRYNDRAEQVMVDVRY